MVELLTSLFLPSITSLSKYQGNRPKKDIKIKIKSAGSNRDLKSFVSFPKRQNRLALIASEIGKQMRSGSRAKTSLEEKTIE